MLSGVLLWISLFAPLSDDDLLRRPEILERRMALLMPGMSEPAAKFVLGISGRRASTIYGLNRYHSVNLQFDQLAIYPLAPQVDLSIRYHYPERTLVSVTLIRGRPRGVTHFPPGHEE